MQLTVPDLDRELTAVLRSLPSAYAITDASGRSDVGIRSADGSLLHAGSRGIIHLDPDPAMVASFDAVPVAMDAMWLEDPALRQAEEWLTHTLDGARFVQVSAVVRRSSRRPRALVAIAAALARVAAVADVRITASRRNATVATMTVGAVPVFVTVATSDNVAGETASIRVVGEESVVRVEVSDGATAAPSSVSRWTRAGTEVAPAIYESARRALGRRLHDAIANGERLGGDYRAAVEVIGDAGGL